MAKNSWSSSLGRQAKVFWKSRAEDGPHGNVTHLSSTQGSKGPLGGRSLRTSTLTENQLLLKLIQLFEKKSYYGYTYSLNQLNRKVKLPYLQKPIQLF